MMARFDGAFVARRLLDHVEDAVHPRPDLRRRLHREDAVAGHLGLRHALHGDDRALHLVEHREHLPQRRRRGVEDVVAEHHRERLVADQVLGDQHGVAEPERLALPDVGQVDQVGDLLHLLQHLVLALRGQERFELGRDVEVILDGVLAAPGDENDVGDARGDGLLDAVLDDRPIDQREHLLRHGLGGGQETRAEAGGGEDGLTNRRSHP